MRNIIIHNHLFKNAGTTFDWSLGRNFGDAFLDHRDDLEMHQGAKYLGPFLLSHPELKALSSHHLKFPLPVLPDVRLLPVVFLRHPIDRVGSVYAFEHKQNSESLGSRMAKKMTFNEYVQWRMQPEAPITIRNFQTSRCLDIPETIKTFITRRLVEADYANARKQIEEMGLLGVVDMYDESMVLFEEYLKPSFPNIDLSYVKQNITSGRKKSLVDRIRSVFNELDFDVTNSMLQHNHFDLMLYLEAKEIVKSRINDLADFKEKLNCFRNRCNVKSM
jgi:hypothetical protein